MSRDIITSFVIPVFNTPVELLERSVKSITTNIDGGYEIILVNDGSTNSETVKKCEELGEERNVIYFSQQNQGVSVARNKGIDESHGKYIIFVDPDDYITDEIGVIVKELDLSNADIILLDYIIETSKGEKTRIAINLDTINLGKEELINNVLFCGTMYSDYYAGAVLAKPFNSDFLKNNMLRFDSSLRKAQDRIFMLYAYSVAKEIHYMQHISYTYYQNFESVCNKYNPNASLQSHYFVKAVSDFLYKTDIKVNSQKLLAMVNYVSFYEILYLDLFNYKNPDSYRINILKAQKEYNLFNISYVTKIYKLRDFKSMSAKFKFMLIKHKWYALLKYIIEIRQRKART